jgi:hypothetical protein
MRTAWAADQTTSAWGVGSRRANQQGAAVHPAFSASQLERIEIQALGERQRPAGKKRGAT